MPFKATHFRSSNLACRGRARSDASNFYPSTASSWMTSPYQLSDGIRRPFYHLAKEPQLTAVFWLQQLHILSSLPLMTDSVILERFACRNIWGKGLLAILKNSTRQSGVAPNYLAAVDSDDPLFIIRDRNVKSTACYTGLIRWPSDQALASSWSRNRGQT